MMNTFQQDKYHLLKFLMLNNLTMVLFTTRVYFILTELASSASQNSVFLFNSILAHKYNYVYIKKILLLF